MQYRQGDVLIERIAALPEKLKPVERDKGRVVLAYGEVTGHAHAIGQPKVYHFRDDGSGGVSYLKVEQKAQVRHEEHAPINLDEGFYKVTRQKEYAPEEVRFVAD